MPSILVILGRTTAIPAGVTISALAAIYIAILYLVPVHLVAFSHPGMHDGLTNSQIIERFGLGDVASYAKGARDVYENGWFTTPASRWAITSWPPGPFLLQALTMQIFGEAAPIPAINAVLVSVLWAGLFLLLREALKPKFGVVLSALAPFSFFLIPEFRQYVLKDGLLASEPFGFAALLGGVIALWLAAERQQRRWAIASGLLFAVAVYFRALFEPMMIAATLLAGALYLLHRRLPDRLARAIPKTAIVLLLVSMAAFHAATIPWRIHNLVAFDSLKWGKVNHKLVALYAWTKYDEDHYMYNAGANTACRVDAAKCDEINREWTENAFAFSGIDLSRAAMRAFFSSPIDWFSIKLRVAARAWFNGPESIILAILALICIPVMAYSAIRHSAGTTLAVLLLIYTAFFGTEFLLITFAPVVPRYLYPFKLLAMLWLLWAVYSVRRTGNFSEERTAEAKR